jgi:hypothetical protein
LSVGAHKLPGRPLSAEPQDEGERIPPALRFPLRLNELGDLLCAQAVLSDDDTGVTPNQLWTNLNMALRAAPLDAASRGAARPCPEPDPVVLSLEGFFHLSRTPQGPLEMLNHPLALAPMLDGYMHAQIRDSQLDRPRLCFQRLDGLDPKTARSVLAIAALRMYPAPLQFLCLRISQMGSPRLQDMIPWLALTYNGHGAYPLLAASRLSAEHAGPWPCFADQLLAHRLLNGMRHERDYMQRLAQAAIAAGRPALARHLPEIARNYPSGRAAPDALVGALPKVGAPSPGFGPLWMEAALRHQAPNLASEIGAQLLKQRLGHSTQVELDPAGPLI